ncbi:MAG: hypothetical protein AB7V26_13870 [Lysobacterales bacterium]
MAWSLPQASVLLRRPWLQLAVLFALLLLSWTRLLDQPAADYLDGALKRTLVTFAVARAVNGSISMLQDADISVSPVGVGVSFSPGELLDPINDLIEQFSSILLLAAISLGTQKILLGISAALPVSIGLGLAGLGLFTAYWRGGSAAARRGWLRIATLLLLLRFLVPVYALASQALDHAFLAPRYAEASAALDLGRVAAESATQPVAADPAAPPAGIGERLTDWLHQAGQSLDWRTRVETLRGQLGAVGDQIVTLSVVFLMQSVLLPLLFLSLGSLALRWSWRIGQAPG